MTNFVTAIIVDNTVLFLGTVLLGLVMVAFPEVLKSGDFSKLKKFFY